jgi:hypothetical protein
MNWPICRAGNKTGKSRTVRLPFPFFPDRFRIDRTKTKTVWKWDRKYENGIGNGLECFPTVSSVSHFRSGKSHILKTGWNTGKAQRHSSAHFETSRLYPTVQQTLPAAKVHWAAGWAAISLCRGGVVSSRQGWRGGTKLWAFNWTEQGIWQHMGRSSRAHGHMGRSFRRVAHFFFHLCSSTACLLIKLSHIFSSKNYTKLLQKKYYISA